MIQITSKSLERMFRYAELAGSREVAGFAKMDNNGIIYETLDIPVQTVTAGTVDIDEKFILPFIKRPDANEILVNWHSHGSGGVFFSSRDESNINDLSRVMNMLVSIVVNNKREYKSRIDYFKPIHVKADINISVITPLPADVDAVMTKQIRNRLRSKPIVTKQPAGHRKNGPQPYSDQWFYDQQYQRHLELARSEFPEFDDADIYGIGGNK